MNKALIGGRFLVCPRPNLSYIRVEQPLAWDAGESTIEVSLRKKPGKQNAPGVGQRSPITVCEAWCHRHAVNAQKQTTMCTSLNFLSIQSPTNSTFSNPSPWRRLVKVVCAFTFAVVKIPSNSAA